MEDITVIAVFTLVFATGVKTLFDWISKRNLQNQNARMIAIESQVVKNENISKRNHELLLQLYAWHDVKDSDGVPIWYVRKSLEELIKQNAEAVMNLSQQSTLQTQVLKELAEGQKETLAEIRRFYIEKGRN